MGLTDTQWEVIEPLLPELPRRNDGRGRLRRPNREVLDGVLWILRTGAAWKDLPERYPPYQTCHRRFQMWVRSGTMDQILRTLAEDLRERGKIDISECFIDGTFSSAKKGAIVLALQSAGNGARSSQSQTLMVFLSPLAWKALRPTR